MTSFCDQNPALNHVVFFPLARPLPDLVLIPILYKLTRFIVVPTWELPY